MPRWAVCKCGEGGAITIRGTGDNDRTIGPGQRVDLDEVILPATKDRKAQTVADAIGADDVASLFDLEVVPTQRQYDNQDDADADI